MIEIENLSKRYGDKIAVDDLSFVVEPGTVTGFLGPNGAGKSTTMRMIAGLDEPTTGTVRVNGKHYRIQPRRRWPSWASCSKRKPCTPAARPATTCSRSVQTARHRPAPGRRGDRAGRPRPMSPASGSAGSASAWASGSASRPRCSAGRRRSCWTSRSTVSTRTACGGSVRCCAELADEGRTVFVSSHLMSEMAQTATRLVVIGRGRLIADSTVADFVAATTAAAVDGTQPGGRPACATCCSARMSSVEQPAARCPARQRPDRRTDRHHRLAGAPAGARTQPCCSRRWRRPSCRPPATAWSTASWRGQPDDHRNDADATNTVAGPVTMPRILLSEWTKFRSLRSSWWTHRHRGRADHRARRDHLAGRGGRPGLVGAADQRRAAQPNSAPSWLSWRSARSRCCSSPGSTAPE